MSRLIQRLLGAVGLVLLGSATVKILAGSGGEALLTLLILGAAFLLVACLWPQVEQLTVKPTELDVRLLREMAELGAPKTGQALGRTELASFAEAYALVRGELDGDRFREARCRLRDRLIDRAAALSRRTKLDPQEVRTLFARSAPTVRVLALGLMEGDVSLADGATIVAAIGYSRSAAEQHQGLVLARAAWHQLATEERRAIHAAIAGNRYIATSEARRRIAEQVAALPVG